MSTMTNAAGRLHALLEEGRKYPPNMVMRDGWRKLLRIENSSTSELLTRIASAITLPEEAEREVRQLQHVEHAHLLVWVKPVQQAFSVLNLSAHWEHFRGPFDKDQSALLALKIAADMISRQFPEPALESDVLDDIRQQVHDVRTEVLNSDLDAGLKEFILEHLREIDYAIEAYHIRGAAGLRHVIQNAYGALLIRPGFREKVERSSVAVSYGKLLRRVLLVVSLSADVMTLAGLAGPVLIAPSAVECVMPDDFQAEPENRPDDSGQADTPAPPIQKA